MQGRYRVTCKLGSGGFGKTYEVIDSDGTIQVLKVLINNDSKYVELFQREAQILTRLRHQAFPKPNLMPISCFILAINNNHYTV